MCYTIITPREKGIDTMTKMTLITISTVSPEDTFTNADFAVAFGHGLGLLPMGIPMTATQIRDAIAPKFTTQKITAYLKMAVVHGIMAREEITTGETWVDNHGNLRVVVKAVYKRI